MIRPIDLVKGKVLILDQTALPGKKKYITISTASEMADAIKTMKIRGAPALGIAAAFGVYLSARTNRDLGNIRADMERLRSSRPTAKNISAVLNMIEKKLTKSKDPAKDILKEALKIQKDDIGKCLAIGKYGVRLIKNGFKVMTYCNAGTLATGQYGTALSPLYAAKKEGIEFEVFVHETRPYMQGSRLTAWELSEAGIKNTLITDNASAYTQIVKQIDLVIVGADRVAKNGDIANKIGTYGLAVTARYHKIPFYTAFPATTFDPECNSGNDIKIEIRPEEEIRFIKGEKNTHDRTAVFNPSFDVTPRALISGYITEYGFFRDVRKMTAFFRGKVDDRS